MKEINIAKKLIEKRREKGITQDEIALYIGVSKASVSKWETGQSYPDITFLPQIATYFNISIDELMGYSPQMSKEDIKKLYNWLSSSFATEPFDDILEECRRIIKKYYCCFPLLFQMSVLLVNHHMLAEEKKEQISILNEAKELCIRIKTESNDIWLSKEATSFEAVCYLMMQQPQDVLDLLGESIRPITNDYEIVGQAYQIMGNISKAKEITQVSMYQHLIALIGGAPSYLMLNSDKSDKFEESLYRALSVASIYNLEELHPNIMAQIYFVAAQIYGSHNDTEKTLDMLQNYVNVCTKKLFPISLHGDSYFDQINGWLADIGIDAPRDESAVKEDTLKIVLSNPAFTFLTEQPRYKSILKQLKINLGGK